MSDQNLINDEICAILEADPTASFAAVGRAFGRTRGVVWYLFHRYASDAAQEARRRLAQEAQTGEKVQSQRFCKWCEQPLYILPNTYHPECQREKARQRNAERQRELYWSDRAAYYARTRASLLKRRAREANKETING